MKNLKIKIVNPKKFAISIILVSMLLCGIIVHISDNTEISVVSYEEYSVNEGDTLWTILKPYCPDTMDIREYVYEVKKYNNCTDCIKTGDIINIPIYA